ncbi:CRBG3 protein, partial [Polypterus senegalus]
MAGYIRPRRQRESWSLGKVSLSVNDLAVEEPKSRSGKVAVWSQGTEGNRTVVRTKSQDEVKPSSEPEERADSSENKGNEIQSTVKEIKEDNASRGPFLDLSKVFQGTEKKETPSKDEARSPDQGPASSPPPSAAASSKESAEPPPLDTFFKKLSSLFHSSSKTDPDGPQSGARQDATQKLNTAVMEGMPKGAMSESGRSTADAQGPACQPSEEESTTEHAEGKPRAADPFDDGLQSGRECGGAAQSLEQQQFNDHENNENHLMQGVDVTCSTEENNSQESDLTSFSSPVVTYGTYRGLKKIKKLMKKHYLQVDLPIPEGGEESIPVTCIITDILPTQAEADDLVPNPEVYLTNLPDLTTTVSSKTISEQEFSSKIFSMPNDEKKRSQEKFFNVVVQKKENCDVINAFHQENVVPACLTNGCLLPFDSTGSLGCIDGNSYTSISSSTLSNGVFFIENNQLPSESLRLCTSKLNDRHISAVLSEQEKEVADNTENLTQFKGTLGSTLEANSVHYSQDHGSLETLHTNHLIKSLPPPCGQKGQPSEDCISLTFSQDTDDRESEMPDATCVNSQECLRNSLPIHEATDKSESKHILMTRAGLYETADKDLDVQALQTEARHMVQTILNSAFAVLNKLEASPLRNEDLSKKADELSFPVDEYAHVKDEQKVLMNDSKSVSSTEEGEGSSTINMNLASSLPSMRPASTGKENQTSACFNEDSVLSNMAINCEFTSNPSNQQIEYTSSVIAIEAVPASDFTKEEEEDNKQAKEMLANNFFIDSSYVHLNRYHKDNFTRPASCDIQQTDAQDNKSNVVHSHIQIGKPSELNENSKANQNLETICNVCNLGREAVSEKAEKFDFNDNKECEVDRVIYLKAVEIVNEVLHLAKGATNQDQCSNHLPCTFDKHTVLISQQIMNSDHCFSEASDLGSGHSEDLVVVQEDSSDILMLPSSCSDCNFISLAHILEHSQNSEQIDPQIIFMEMGNSNADAELTTVMENNTQENCSSHDIQQNEHGSFEGGSPAQGASGDCDFRADNKAITNNNYSHVLDCTLDQNTDSHRNEKDKIKIVNSILITDTDTPVQKSKDSVEQSFHSTFPASDIVVPKDLNSSNTKDFLGLNEDQSAFQKAAEGDPSYINLSVETPNNIFKDIFDDMKEEEELEQLNSILDSDILLCPSFRRGKVYPTSLSPIFEEESFREESLLDDQADSPFPDEALKSKVEDASSILSLLQLVSDRLRLSTLSESIDDDCSDTHMPGVNFDSENEEIVNHMPNTTDCSNDSSLPNVPQDISNQNVSFHNIKTSQLPDHKDSRSSPSSFSFAHKATAETPFYQYVQSMNSSLSVPPPHDTQESKRTKQDLSNTINWNDKVPDIQCEKPSLIIFYSGPVFTGKKQEILTDVPDARSITYTQNVSVQVVRGSWILYENPGYKGQYLVLEEGEMVLNHGFADVNSMESCSVNMMIGSIRRIAQDTSVPEIEIWPEAGRGGSSQLIQKEIKKLETYGQVPGISSFTVHSGSWLAYDDFNFCGNITVLEVNGCSKEKKQHINGVRSLRPMKMGGLKVQTPLDPKVIVYETASFLGRSKEFKDNLPSVAAVKGLAGVGSLKVIGGVWVAYAKEEYKGEQYLLEEGEYSDCHAWGGFDSSIHSLRHLQAINKTCLVVSGGKPLPGTKVGLWKKHGRIHQLWKTNQDGTISTCLDDGLVLSVKGGKSYDKDHLVITPVAASDLNQYWDIQVL